MFSRLHATRRFACNLQPRLVKNNNQIAQNFIIKRGSGHNVMNIEPSNYGWKHHKDMMHFYFLLSVVPVAIINTIISLRANPELTEIPEGYEPRHWEYFRHPITRWMAKHMFMPMETEHELMMSFLDGESQAIIMRKLQKNVEKAMKFYNDHRTSYFRPMYAEYLRIGRDNTMHGIPYMGSNEGHYYEYAYDPNINPVPTEGYKPE